MELFIGLNSFLVVHSSILSQASKLTVVQNTWDDRLTNNSVSSVVDNCRCKVVQSINFKNLEVS